MKRLIIGLLALVSMGFISPEIDESITENIETNLKIQEDILAYQKIIVLKENKAKLLKIKAKKIASKKDEAEKMLKEAYLIKMNCLKYQAAIACLQQHNNKQ